MIMAATDGTPPAVGQEHTHDNAPDGTVAKVVRHDHTGDPLGVKRDHEHGADEAVVVAGSTGIISRIMIMMASTNGAGEDPAPADGQEHTHDGDGTVSDVSDSHTHDHETDKTLADHEHGSTTVIDSQDVDPATRECCCPCPRWQRFCG